MNLMNIIRQFQKKYRSEIKVGLIVMAGLIVLRILKDLIRRS